MKFLVVTPCYNAESLIERTLKSVIEQSCDGVDITYVVFDGSSQDNTINILSSYVSQFSESNIRFEFYSKKDKSMYDAIANGFLQYSHEVFDVYAYINAGDFFACRAFKNLSCYMTPNIHWITGINIIYNEQCDIVGARLPGPYSSRLIQTGFFGTMLPCIQQESTFWDHAAHILIDFNVLSQLKLAGDFYIWKCISSKNQLYVLSLWLAGFTKHTGQLSEIRRNEYYAELKSLAITRKPLEYILAILYGCAWLLPNSVRLKLFSSSIRTFD